MISHERHRHTYSDYGIECDIEDYLYWHGDEHLNPVDYQRTIETEVYFG